MRPVRLLASALFLAVVAAGALAYVSANGAPSQPVAISTSPAASQDPAVSQAHAAGARVKETLPSEVVTITPRGFEPAEIVRPPGRFFLAVENRSGRRGLTLRLDPERGNRVREIVQPEDELDWVDELHLSPGRYSLTVAGRPNWVCSFTVTAQ